MTTKNVLGIDVVGGPNLSPEGQLELQDGSAALPAASFLSDPTTGFYKSGTAVQTSVGGTAVSTLSATGLTLAGSVSCGTNSVTCGSLLGSGAVQGSSLYISGSPGSGQINGSLACFGLESIGTVSCLTYGLTCGALSSGAITATGTVQVPGGSASAPSLIFSTDTTTGLYRNGAAQTSIASNGVETFRVGNGSIQAFAGISAGTNSLGCGAVTAAGTISCGTNAMTCGAMSCSSLASTGLVSQPQYNIAVTVGTQSIGNNSYTAVSWTSQLSGSGISFSNPQTTFTLPVAGMYAFSYVVSFAPNTSGTRESGLSFNGAGNSNQYAHSLWLAAGTFTRMSGACLRQCAANDTVSLLVVQNTGGSLNIGGDSTTLQNLTIDWLHA